MPRTEECKEKSRKEKKEKHYVWLWSVGTFIHQRLGRLLLTTFIISEGPTIESVPGPE